MACVLELLFGSTKWKAINCFSIVKAEQRSLQIIAALLIGSNPLNKETQITAYNLEITTTYKEG